MVITAVEPTYQNVITMPVFIPGGVSVYEFKLTFTTTFNNVNTSWFARASIDGGATWSVYQKEPKDVTDSVPFSYLFPIEYDTASPIGTQILLEFAKENLADELIVEFADTIFTKVR